MDIITGTENIFVCRLGCCGILYSTRHSTYVSSNRLTNAARLPNIATHVVVPPSLVRFHTQHRSRRCFCGRSEPTARRCSCRHPVSPTRSSGMTRHDPPKHARCSGRGRRAAARDGVAWQPAGCSADTVPVVFPNSSADRTEHLLGLMRRLGGCGKIVPAVMRDRVVGRGWRPHRERATIFNSSVCHGNRFPVAIGRLPNTATLARMYAAASATAGISAGWAMMMEDDAQLHADLRTTLPTPADGQDAGLVIRRGRGSQTQHDQLRRVSRKALALQADPGELPAAAVSAVPGHPTGHLRRRLRMRRDLRHPGQPRSRAAVVRSAYDTLNSGSTACPTKLISSASCGRDPFALVSYIG